MDLYRSLARAEYDSARLCLAAAARHVGRALAFVIAARVAGPLSASAAPAKTVNAPGGEA